MRIAHLQPTSFIDYPAKLAAVVFTQGCNFRCPYCHNPELVEPRLFGPALAEDSVFEFLARRRGKLDAVVVTGGEPSLHADLPDFIARVKALGFLVKLDTNGTNPALLSNLLDQQLLDYVAMDIKAPLDNYESVSGCALDAQAIAASIDMLLGVSCLSEFRTTLVAGLLNPEDVLSIGRRIAGARLYALQNFTASKHVDAAYLTARGFEAAVLAGLKAELEKLVGRVALR